MECHFAGFAVRYSASYQVIPKLVELKGQPALNVN